jgi:hypothetical protein
MKQFLMFATLALASGGSALSRYTNVQLSMLDGLFDLTASILECFVSWRFYLCLAMGAATIGGVVCWLPESGLRTTIAVGGGIISAVGGIIWEWRAT